MHYYIRALNLGFDNKTADKILIAWPAACRISYSVLGSLGVSGKSVGSIAIFFYCEVTPNACGGF